MATRTASPTVVRGPHPKGARTGAHRAPRYRLWRIGGYVLMLGIWWFFATFFFEPYALPPPQEVVKEMGVVLTGGDFWVNFWATVEHLLIGFTLALILGTAIGVLMGRSDYWDGFFRDYIMTTLTLPGLVFALIAVMIFGLAPVGPIFAIVFCALPHITVNVVEGVRAIPQDLIDMARAYGVSRRRVTRSVILPAVAPFWFNAIRYGFAISWKITALTELFGGADGVGIQMRVEFQFFNVAGVLAWALFLVGFAILIERLVLQRIETRFFRWRPEVFT